MARECAASKPASRWQTLTRFRARGALLYATQRRFQGLDAGDHVHIKLVHTDVELEFIDFVRD